MPNKLRLMTTVFLTNEDDVLLLQRSKKKLLAPGMWSGVGGHVESYEHDDIHSSGLREIYEETGLTESEIDDLKLRYIVLRQKERELRQQFVYFGTVTTRALGNTDEGTLHWIHWNDALNREMTETTRYILKHYIEHHTTNDVWVGTMGANDDHTANISWSSLSDWS